MNPLLIGPIADLLKTIIGKIWPDPAKQQEAATELLRMQQAGELAELQATITLATAQTDINKVEAASSNIFVAGWRPAAGWVCVIGLLYSFLLQPFLSWVGFIFKIAGPPIIDDTVVLTLLGTLLGVGTLRTVDKIKGVASK
jgi:hypothetical protein